jgi:parvulin-like peptidyl-prolyl isomerase
MFKKILVLLVLVLINSGFSQLLSGNNLDVIKIGKSGYTKGRIDSLTQMLAIQQFQGKQVPAEVLSQLKDAVIDNLIGQELLGFEAEKLGVKAEPQLVDSLIFLFKSQFPSEDVFQKELKKSGSTLKDFKDKVIKQVKSDKLLEQKVPYPKEPSDAELKSYFESNKKELPISDTISGSQIYLKILEGEGEKAINDKKKILEGLAAQVRSQKAGFAQLAAQYSDDPQASKTGGILTKFLASDFGAAFEKAVKNLKVGEVSEVFQTKIGVHIFILTEKNDGKFDSYKHKVDYLLRLEKEKQRQVDIKKYLDTLAKKYPVTYLDKEYTPEDPIGAK